ncbi:MAG: transposase [Saprospiraceae bacterium]
MYWINGVEDHLHIVTHIHPTVALAYLVKDIKIASSIYIKEKKLFRGFERWQIGYGAFTYSIEAKDNLIEYVKNQEIHHKEITYREELLDLLLEHRADFDEQYFE